MDFKAVAPAKPADVSAQQPAAQVAPRVEPLIPAEGTRVAESPGELAPVRTAQEWRRLWTKLSIIPFFVVPVILGFIYFAFIAADRYAVESKFSIRLVSGSPSSDLLGSIAGFSSAGSTVTDSYILIDFIESREVIDKLSERIDLRDIYSHEDADFYMAFDPDETIEEFREYLDGMISVYYDSSSQIITMEVQAFTPEDAKLVASQILLLGEELVNELSEKSRGDSLKNAQDEVNRNEDRLRNNRANMRKFRDVEQDLDPSKTAESQITLLSSVEANLSAARAEMTNLLRFMEEDAPSVKVLRSKIKAFEEQASLERARLGIDTSKKNDGSSDTLSARLEAYEVLALEQEFSQKAYVSALASLEHARVEADRQQRYLTAFVHPSVPQEAIYPERILNIFILVFAALMVWGICVMTAYIVREHAT